MTAPVESARKFALQMMLDLNIDAATELVEARDAAIRAEALARCRLLTEALAGEAVKVSEYDGEWRCVLCGASGEDDEAPIRHNPDCVLVGDGGEGGT